MSYKRLAGWTGMAGGLRWPTAASAQAIEDIVVVTQKRAQSVQEVPISIPLAVRWHRQGFMQFESLFECCLQQISTRGSK